MVGSALTPWDRPNDLRISCGAIMRAPTQTYASLAAPPKCATRAEPRAFPARRLHARVRRRLAPTAPDLR